MEIVMDVLDEARLICDGDRTNDYGRPEDSYARIAEMWSIILRQPVTARQVAQCMIGLKLVRDSHRPKLDNLVDIAGYALCAERCSATPHA